MMERRCFRQAFETFKDAVAAMKHGTSDKRGESVGPSVVRSLQQAHQRLVRQERSASSLPLLVVSHETSSADLCPTSSIFSAYTLIRLDDVDLAEQDESNESLLTTIMLYNFATSYLCRAHCTKNAALANKLRHGGMKLFSLSRSLLASLYRKLQNDMFLLPRLVFISSQLFQTLSYAFQASGNHRKAKECAMAVASLQSAASEMQEPRSGVPAAAAA